MDLKLKGLTAIVTGGSLGIGYATVQSLINEGCNVAFCSRSQQNIDKALSKLDNPHKVNITAKALDINNSNALSQWFKELAEFDILVCNVSALSLELINNPERSNADSAWDSLINTDLKSTVKLIDLAEPFLEKSPKAAITYISSIAGSIATTNMPSYGAIKASLNHYFKSLSKRLITKQIRVNVVSPGDIYIEGGFWDKIKQQKPEIYQQALARNLRGTLGTADEIASVVTFISSPMASFVCGANWLVDGNATTHIQN
jgi:NAD(P)-dependent dehydrogenase (short-subunit alcohol dehydrogenase family)